jgi:hypothetical protein
LASGAKIVKTIKNYESKKLCDFLKPPQNLQKKAALLQIPPSREIIKKWGNCIEFMLA